MSILIRAEPARLLNYSPQTSTLELVPEKSQITLDTPQAQEYTRLALFRDGLLHVNN